MRTAKVVVVPYDEKWKSDFETIKDEICAVTADLIIAVEHVGSTSVEGMAAKPCIDIDVVIKDYSVLDEVIARLSAIGYIYEGDLGIKDRHAFKYADKPHLQQHHLYVCPQNSAELHRHITFRDFLRGSPQAVRWYSQVKTEAAALYPQDIDGYINYKTPCIQRLYSQCGLE